MTGRMAGKTVLLGVTGSVAAYKAVSLASALVKAGATVIAVLTANATRFVAPLSFETLTRRPVVTELFGGRSVGVEESRHISLASAADLLLIAPATANIIAKMANGIADDILTCTAMATRAPIVVAPAMNTNMYNHPATRRNIEVLTERGCRFVGPEEGRLADGSVGLGRMAAEPAILAVVGDVLCA